jgi:hypothetical protein
VNAYLARLLAAAALGFGPALAAIAYATGAPGAFRSPEPGARLMVGATARVLWDAPPRAAGDAEAELVLSLDGGRTFPIRLTRDFAPDESAVLWRVPSLPTRAARIALRVGDDGGPEEERILIVSAEFEIASDDGAPSALEPLFPVRGEWRTEEARDPESSLPSPNLSGESPDGLRALPGRDPAVESPPGAAAPTRDASSRSAESVARSRVSSAAPPLSALRPAFPLRP